MNTAELNTLKRAKLIRNMFRQTKLDLVQWSFKVVRMQWNTEVYSSLRGGE